MQDLYAFDIGDFGKFGLLRMLTQHAEPLTLGVIWYATNLGSKGGDGKHTGYLNLNCDHISLRAQRTFRICDEPLYDVFRAHLKGHGREPKRSIAALEHLGVLAGNSRYVGAVVPQGSEARSNWFRNARANVRGVDLVFVDPDNGLAADAAEEKGNPSQRHVLWSELRELYGDGASLVIYHHLNREKGGHERQIETRLAALRAALAPTLPAWGMRYRRGSGRVFFVLPQAEQVDVLCAAMNRLRTGVWVSRGHMTVFEAR